MNRTRFLPERLRPGRPALRRVRRGLVSLAVLPVVVAAAPLWRIRDVHVTSCPGVPSEVVESVESLVGRPMVTVRLSEIRERVERWPGVASVDVSLELPGSLVVVARPCEVRASVPGGGSFRAVHEDGTLGQALTTPWRPLLEGFGGQRDRRRAVEVAARVARSCGLEVAGMSWVTPDDYRLELTAGGAPAAIVHVRPEGSVAEAWWCERALRGELPATWSDLRGASRAVLGGGP